MWEGDMVAKQGASCMRPFCFCDRVSSHCVDQADLSLSGAETKSVFHYTRLSVAFLKSIAEGLEKWFKSLGH